jgi:hypothetical protein
MNIRYLLTLLILIIFNINSSEARSSPYGVFVEPGITYEIGNSSISYPAPFSNSSGSSNGFGLMGRLGVHFSEIFFAAIDGRFKVVQFKDSTNNYNADATSFDVAPVIGVQMPEFGLRFWGSYVVTGQLDPKQSNSLDLRFEDAQGIRLGAGIRFLSLSVNIEYQDLKYGRTTLEQLGPFSSIGESHSIQLKNESYILSLSFPIEI